MILAVMQPYFFPYWGHFALIAAVDNWIVFDISQYTPKTWMSRNRVLKPATGWQYISVPLSNSSISIKTCEAKVLDVSGVGSRLLRQLEHYRRHAPFYPLVTKLVEDVFTSVFNDSLVDLNVVALDKTCQYLDIAFKYVRCSDLSFNFPESLGPGDWAVQIASQFGACMYINPISGAHLFDPLKFQAHGVDLAFLEAGNYVYPTPGYSFEPNLSIIDVMMWNSPEVIRSALITCTIKKPIHMI